MKSLFGKVQAFAYVNAGAITKTAATVVALAIPTAAHAQNSVANILTGIEGELRDIMPIAMLIIGSVGMIIAGISLISAWSAKKNKQPLEWQGWGIVIGALVTIVPLIVSSFTGTLSGGNADGSQMIDSMNLNNY